MRIAPKILLPVVLLAASLAGAGYLRATKPEVTPAPETETVWSVRAVTVERRDHQPILDLYGQLVAGREVTIRPKVAGEVIEASDKLREGGRFAEGEVMLRIDPFDYQAAIDDLRAQTAEAAARRDELSANRATEETMLVLDRDQRDLIRRDVERYERLSGSRAASEKALDDARIALSRQTGTVSQREQAIVMLEAKLAQQDAVIARLSVAERRARRDLADTTIKAPFAGVIADVGAERGQQLGLNDTVALLIDDRALEISFQLADADFGRLWQSGLIGRKVTGRWKLGRSEFALPATIARVVPTIDPASGGVTVYASLDDRHDDVPLRPGAFIEIEMQDRLYEDVVQLPASALFDQDTVYVIADSRLRAERVDLVSITGSDVLVRADIAEGTEILASRLAEVAPGLRVEVVEAGAAE
ncbi:MAG: efflux RND transporter periplasmic adaptor subunit [Alphaproteobacteria bacterium]